eukprot:scaffold2995_cov135-Skeletonema_menzelii.AAC.9
MLEDHRSLGRRIFLARRMRRIARRLEYTSQRGQLAVKVMTQKHLAEAVLCTALWPAAGAAWRLQLKSESEHHKN